VFKRASIALVLAAGWKRLVENPIMSRKVWQIGLAVFLFLWAALEISNLRIEFQNVVMGLVAAFVAICLVVDL
jgi:hypothetical protein